MATVIAKGPDGLEVGDEPIIPFIEGDGIGPDIWAAARAVFDAAVDKAYGGRRTGPGSGSPTRPSKPSAAIWSGSRGL